MNIVPSKLSISCFGVPNELLDKSVAKTYFGKFGLVTRIRIRPKYKICIVEYNTEALAQHAFENAGIFNGQTFRIAWTKTKPVDKKKEKTKIVDMDDTQVELEAMRGDFTSDYNLKPEGNPKLISKRTSGTLKKSRDRERKIEKVKQTDSVIINISHNPEEETELLHLMKMSAFTCEEKYRVLEARDKLIRLRNRNVHESNLATKTIGTCPDMCPEKERLMREHQHQVAVYEQMNGTKGVMNHAIAVKQYSRSSANQEFPLAHELRPVRVLQLTMSYLLHRIMDLSELPDANLAEWYHFVWDRTRGIRKDITLQQLCCQHSVEVLEQCARFHIHCSARLVAEDISVFDEKINTENLTKCLQSLKYMYHDLALKGEQCPNEAEFRAYIVLLNLNDGNFMWEVQQFSRQIQQSVQVKFAIDVHSALDKNNYVKFFKLVRATTYLNACILFRYFNQIRSKALITIVKSYSPGHAHTQFPLDELQHLLAFEDLENTIGFVTSHELHTNTERTHVILNRRSFQQLDDPFLNKRAVRVIESKRNASVGRTICGSDLPPKYYENHRPENSFDELGYFRSSELLLKESPSTRTETTNDDEIDFDFSSPIPPPTITIEDDRSENNNIFTEQYTLNSNQSEHSEEMDYAQNQSNIEIEEEEDNLTETVTPAVQFSFLSNNNKQSSFHYPVPKTQPESFQALLDVDRTSKPVFMLAEQSSSQVDLVENNRIQEELRKKQQEELEQREEAKRTEIETKRRLELEEMIKLRKLKEAAIARAAAVAAATAAKQKAIQIQIDIEAVLNKLLTQVEENQIKTRLKQIANKIKTRQLLRYVQQWRNLTQIAKNKRKCFFDNPVWISPRSLSTEAREFRFSTENDVLHDMKRYKLGTSLPPRRPVFPQKPKIRSIPVCQLVGRTLFEKSNIRSHIYWKIGVSIPTVQLNQIDAILDGAFPQKIAQQQHVNNGGTLTYSIRKIHSDAGKDLHGLLFFHFSPTFQPVSSYQRLLSNLPGNFHPIPVVIITNDSEQSNVIQDLMLQKFLMNGTITVHRIVHYTTLQSLETILSDSLKFLAEHSRLENPLEMDLLASCFRNSITVEMWQRIESTADLSTIIREPAVAIDIHNNAVDHLFDIISKTDNFKFPDFPKEFRQFCARGTSEIILPCTYEHFPPNWKSKSHQKEIKTVIKTLYLPEFRGNWPPTDENELQIQLRRYCSQIFPVSTTEQIVLEVISSILKKSECDEISWADIVQLLVREMIQLCAVNHICVVYHKIQLKAFLHAPWWYNLYIVKSKLRERAFVVNNQDENQPANNRSNIEEEIVDIDKMYTELIDESSTGADDVNNLKLLLDDLESSMRIQKKIMTKFQDTAKYLLDID